MDKELPDKWPKSIYQCVSKPGQCKFEWTCSPLCACLLEKRGGAGTEQEKKDIRIARARQARWRWRMKKKYPKTHGKIKKIKLGPQHKKGERRGQLEKGTRAAEV